MLVNGKRQSDISILNRGLAYGDGLFETILLHHGHPVMLDRHLKRLKSGLKTLGIQDCMSDLLKDIAFLKNDLGKEGLERFGVMKIIVSRGAGGRGYSPSATSAPDRIITLHTAPDYTVVNPALGIKVFVSSIRLAVQPQLAGLKHLNRLEQVLASKNWKGAEGEFYESLMLDTNHNVIEGTKSNIFAVIDGQLFTPDLTNSGVRGVLRELLIEEFAVKEKEITFQELSSASEIFFCNSVGGVWPVLELHYDVNHSSSIHKFSIGSFASKAQSLFQQIVQEASNS